MNILGGEFFYWSSIKKLGAKSWDNTCNNLHWRHPVPPQFGSTRACPKVEKSTWERAEEAKCLDQSSGRLDTFCVQLTAGFFEENDEKKIRGLGLVCQESNQSF